MSEQPKLLVIELNTLGAVPKVTFKGEEVKYLMEVGFNWKTKGHDDVITESPYIRIESMENVSYHPALKVQGYNEQPAGNTYEKALTLAIIGLNKALEAMTATNEDPFKDAGDIWSMGDSLTTEEAVNNITKANQAMPSAKDLKDSGEDK